MKKAIRIIVLSIFLICTASAFGMYVRCISFGGGGGLTCNVCAFFDDVTGEQVGSSVICH